ncbi:MAG TPA: glycerol-3-phosphate 1-O-acyltransferase PlsY [Thermoanaerobaculia bacterium]|jgi:glycerol-3-phosphate acyltransferase PlsY|nr:glycerol-3-phosphate 1-O-acyltransferase PlsY [Thermoanaerobaculia bacterium]
MLLTPSLVIFAYVIGSIPFSYLVARAFAGKDVREEGSRNVGATNVARTAGRGAGILALVLDLAKGYAVVVIARWLVGRPDWPFAAGVLPWESREMWIALAGLIAVLGHMFPIWLGFHGGKGVATAAGVVLALDPRVFLASIIVFAIVVVLSRMVSLGSILTAASIPLLFRFVAHEAPFWRTILSIGIALAIILKHHSNIARLARGTERKLGRKKEDE